jgi:CheY-like chemotaxis protein
MSQIDHNTILGWNPRDALPSEIRMTNHRKAGRNSVEITSRLGVANHIAVAALIILPSIVWFTGVQTWGVFAVAAACALWMVACLVTRSGTWSVQIDPSVLRLRSKQNVFSAGRTAEIPLNAIEAIHIRREGSSGKASCAVSAGGKNVRIASGYSDATLQWLKNYLVMELAGLTWRPIGSSTLTEKANTLLSPPNPVMIDPQLTSRLIVLYMENAPGRRAALWSALRSGDCVAIRANAHWLKSASASVGAHHLSEIYQLIELTARSGSEPELAMLMKQADRKISGLESWLTDLTVRAASASLAAVKNGTDSAPSPESRPAKWDVRVLVADDSPLSREIARDSLSPLVSQVDFAENGAQAVQAWRHGAYAAIFMDCEMIGMDGFEATKIIRKEELQSNRLRTPIIALTSHILQDYRDRCAASGMDDYVQKPYRKVSLETALAKWLKNEMAGTR